MGQTSKDGERDAAAPAQLRHVLAIPHLQPRGVEVKLFFAGVEPATGTAVELAGDRDRVTCGWGGRLFLPMPDAALWSPEAPNLHGLTVNVGNETRRIRFGLRRVEALGSKLLLNGEPFYVRGFGCDGNSRGCLRRQVQTPPGFRNYVTCAKQFGFNVMRSHCGGNDRPEGFLDACDELGLFIWPELDFDPDGDGSILWSILRRYLASSRCDPSPRMTVEELARYRDRMLREPQPAPRPSAESYWDIIFYRDDEVNGRDRFADGGESAPWVSAPWGDR